MEEDLAVQLKESAIDELVNKDDITDIDFADEKFRSVNLSQVC